MSAELSSDLVSLIDMAKQAREHAYAPYSGFRVGAAVRTRDGRTFSGANVENISYGLTVCAERNAIMQAVLAGAKELFAIAVASDISPPAAPCGMCRQTMIEFAVELTIALCNLQGEVRVMSLSELLPQAFRPADLPRGRR